MSTPPPKGLPPTCEELAEAAAYMAHRAAPSAETDAVWRVAWFAATGGKPIWTETRCADCGLHRSYAMPGDSCRNCGSTNVKI